MANDSRIEQLRSIPDRDEEDERVMKELENAIRSPPFIFKLPESVVRANPDAFLPRLIALGPQNAKNKMELYKLYMANKVRGELHLPEFDQLCTQLRTFKLRIQACYDTHFEITGDNLARIMLVDALFLLRLLLNISDQMKNSASIELPLPNFEGQINSLDIDHKMLLNDVLKLENQIPLVVFEGILGDPLKVKFPVLADHFSKSISPFGFLSYAPTSEISAILDQSHHLLHFMYLWILIYPCTLELVHHQAAVKVIDDHLALTFFQKWFSRLESVLDFIQNVKELIGLIQKLVELIRMVKKETFAHKTTSSPVIPSASQLQKLPFNFESTAYGIRDTSFTKPQRGFVIPQGRLIPPKLTLPVMNINAFTETLFENLLAFEAMANINPHVFSLYLELMKALIRNPKDVQILKEKGIIKSHDLDNDEQVVKLFNRLGSSIPNLKSPTIKNFLPTTFSFIAINRFEQEYKRMIEDINQYYDSFWRVKARRITKMFLSCVWKMLPILLILFQIFKVAKEWVAKFIGNDEPNYDHIPAT